MYDNLQMRQHLTELLSRRRNYRQEIKNLINQYQYVVFYGCGSILASIIDAWNFHIGRKIDYCCDSDSSKWGQEFCNAKCISPYDLIQMKDKCAVFVTIGDFEPIFEYLIESGFSSVNQIYKYDLDASELLTKISHDHLTDKLCQTYELLADEKSQKVFEAIVNRVLGSGKDPYVMAAVFEGDQYFPADIVKLSPHENFVDIGAFNGDTIKIFLEQSRANFDRVFSFEVDRNNFALLQENITQMPHNERIKIFNVGIWDSECDITYSVGNSQSTIGDGDGRGHVIPLDEALQDENITFVKMDIEGAEIRALMGAKNIIRSQKPTLAICIYHDFQHLWEIPLYLKSLVPEYKIYLRHHTKLEYETVCYAVI